jgi:hydroxymethylpyrimidine pyrophosphatase-like HAD family hydrolase
VKHPPTKCVAIDVDGTLVINGRLNVKLSEWAKLRKQEGFEVILWSARGSQYATDQAAKHGVTDCFTVIISKPGFIVDDLGWSWVKYTKILTGWGQ